MPAQLVSLTEGPTILLDRPIILIGRHPECDIQIDSRKVSRRHCCIAQVNDYLVVRDLDSTNGIRINGISVLEGRLAPGDELTIGSHRYQVVWGDAPIPPSPQAQAKQPLASDLDDDKDSWDEPVALPEPDGSPRLPANKRSGPPPIRND